MSKSWLKKSSPWAKLLTRNLSTLTRASMRSGTLVTAAEITSFKKDGQLL